MKPNLCVVAFALVVSACASSESKRPPTAHPEATQAPEGAIRSQTPGKPTLLALEKEALRTVLDAIQSADAKRIAGAYAEDAQVVVAGAPDRAGRQAIARGYQEWFDGFPAMKFGFSRMFAKGDVVVAEWAWSGTLSLIHI